MRIHDKFLLGICLFAFSGIVFAQEQQVKMEDLPPAVQATVKEQSKGATIHGLSKEVEHGETTYEAELMVNGHGKDVSMDKTGKVVEVEEEVPLARIPAAAKAAIEKGAEGGEIVKVESVTHGDLIVAYEASVRKAGKHSEVRVDAKGIPAPESD